MAEKKIGAAKFKAECLSILDNLTADGVIVTKHGRPVARVLPVATTSAALIGALRNEIEIHGDTLSTGVDWKVDAES